MRLFNGMHIPYYLRLTGTIPEERESSGREDEEWGIVIVKQTEEIQEKIYQDKELFT